MKNDLLAAFERTAIEGGNVPNEQQANPATATLLWAKLTLLISIHNFSQWTIPPLCNSWDWKNLLSNENQSNVTIAYGCVTDVFFSLPSDWIFAF